MIRSFKLGSFPLLLASLFALCTLTSFATGVSTTLAQSTIDCTAYTITPVAGTPNTSQSMPAAATPQMAASPVAFPEDGGKITVFAAASLTDAFNEIGAAITATNPNVTLTFNFAGSQALVTQLTDGAEADVFASANKTQMTAAQDANTIASEPVVFAKNELVLIVPADNPAGIESLANLAKPDVKFVTALGEVPVGNYTRQSICQAGTDTATYGDDFVNQVAGNIVSEEDNVKAIVTKVSFGEADAGIAYATDIMADVAASVKIITIPAAVNVLAEYPVALVTTGDSELGQAFIDYLLSPDGQAILAKWGFRPGQ